MVKPKYTRQKLYSGRKKKIHYDELRHYIINIVKVSQDPVDDLLFRIRNSSTPKSPLKCKIDLFGIILDKIKFEGIKQLYSQSNIHQDTLNRIIFLRFMLITFDEKSFLDEYKNKQRIVDSTTQNVKVTSMDSVQNVERCNENNCNDVDLRQYLQGINDGMDILLSLRNIPQIKPIENMIAMFQVILYNSAQIDLSYANGMIKYQTYQRICYIRNLLKYFDKEAFEIYCKEHLIALDVNVELVCDDNSSKKRTAFSSPSLSDLTSHSCSRTSVKRIRTTTKISMTSNESLNSSNSHTPTKISCSSISGRESLKQSLTNKNHNTEHSSSSTSSIGSKKNITSQHSSTSTRNRNASMNISNNNRRICDNDSTNNKTKISCSSISGKESLKQPLTNKNHNTEHSSSSTSSIGSKKNLSNNRVTIYKAPTSHGKNSQHSSTSTRNYNASMNISNNNRRIFDNDSTNNNLLISKNINISNDLNNINNNNTANIGKEIENNTSNNTINRRISDDNNGNKIEKNRVITSEKISRIHQKEKKSQYYDYGTITNIIIDDKKKDILSEFVETYNSHSVIEKRSLAYLRKFKLDCYIQNNESEKTKYCDMCQEDNVHTILCKHCKIYNVCNDCRNCFSNDLNIKESCYACSDNEESINCIRRVSQSSILIDVLSNHSWIIHGHCITIHEDMKKKIDGYFCSYGNQCIVKVTQENNIHNELKKRKMFMKKCDCSGCEEYIHEACYLYDNYKINREIIKGKQLHNSVGCTPNFINGLNIRTNSKEHFCPNHRYRWNNLATYSNQMEIISYIQTKDFRKIDSIYTDTVKLNGTDRFNQCQDLLHEIVKYDEHNSQNENVRSNVTIYEVVRSNVQWHICNGSCISKDDYEFGWILIQSIILKNDSRHSIKARYYLWLNETYNNELKEMKEPDSNIANKNTVTNSMIRWINDKDDNFFNPDIDNVSTDDDSMYDCDNNKFDNMNDVYGTVDAFNKSKAIAIATNLRFTLSEYSFICPCSTKMNSFWISMKDLQIPETPCSPRHQFQSLRAMIQHCKQYKDINHVIVYEFFNRLLNNIDLEEYESSVKALEKYNTNTFATNKKDNTDKTKKYNEKMDLCSNTWTKTSINSNLPNQQLHSSIECQNDEHVEYCPSQELSSQLGSVEHGLFSSEEEEEDEEELVEEEDEEELFSNSDNEENEQKSFTFSFLDTFSECSSMVLSSWKAGANKSMESNKKIYIPDIITTDNKNKVPAKKVPTSQVVESNKKISLPDSKVAANEVAVNEVMEATKKKSISEIISTDSKLLSINPKNNNVSVKKKKVLSAAKIISEIISTDSKLLANIPKNNNVPVKKIKVLSAAEIEIECEHDKNEMFGFSNIGNFVCKDCHDGRNDAAMIAYLNDDDVDYLLKEETSIPNNMIHAFLRLLHHSTHVRKEIIIHPVIITGDEIDKVISTPCKQLSKPLTILSVIHEYYKKENEIHFYAMKIEFKKRKALKSIVACSSVMYNGVITEKDIKFDYEVPTKRLLKIVNKYNMKLNDENEKNFRNNRKPLVNINTIIYEKDKNRLPQSSSGICRNSCGATSCLEILKEYKGGEIKKNILNTKPENYRREFIYQWKVLLSRYRKRLFESLKKEGKHVNFFQTLRYIQYTCRDNSTIIELCGLCHKKNRSYTFEYHIKNDTYCFCQTPLPYCLDCIEGKKKRKEEIRCIECSKPMDQLETVSFNPYKVLKRISFNRYKSKNKID